MNSDVSIVVGLLFWLILFGGIVFIGIVTVKIFRHFIRRMGMEKVMAEGVVLGEMGIEFPRFLFLGVGKLAYTEIASVELVHFPRTLLLRMRYKNIVERMGPNFGFFQDVILLETKPSQLFRYMTFQPKNLTLIYQGIKERIGQVDKSGIHGKQVPSIS